MAESELPFIGYRSGLGIKFVPRNRAGWIALGWWTAAMLIMTGLFVALIARVGDGPAAMWLTGGYLVLTALWGWTMYVWIKRRSEIVDVEELLRLKREAETRDRRRGR